MTDDDHDDDAPLSRDELLAEAHEAARKWAFQPGEREQIEAEMAERQRQIDSDKTLEWSRQRNAARQAEPARPVEPWRSGDTVVTKSHRPAPAAAAPASLTADWQRYIRQQLDKRDRAMIGAIGDTIGKDIVAVERSNAALRKDVDRLTAELAELKSELKTRAALAEVTERLERLEAAPARPALKALAG